MVQSSVSDSTTAWCPLKPTLITRGRTYRVHSTAACVIASALLPLAGSALSKVAACVGGCRSSDRAHARLFKTPAADESSRAIAKPENSEDRPGLDILFCALLLVHSLIHNYDGQRQRPRMLRRLLVGARRRGLPDGNDALLGSAILV